MLMLRITDLFPANGSSIAHVWNSCMLVNIDLVSFLSDELLVRLKLCPFVTDILYIQYSIYLYMYHVTRNDFHI